MAYEITNLFKELEIPTSVTGKDEVIAAIDKQIKIWQARVNNPRYKLEATPHTSALKKLRAEVISNPSIISQHAAAYSEIEKRERIRKEKEIRDAGRIFVQNGEIAKEHLAILANKVKLPEQTILDILGVKVKTARKKLDSGYEDDGIEELGRVEMNKIEVNLKPLAGPENLYQFLGVRQNSPKQEIAERVEEISRIVSADQHKTDPAVTAKKNLADLSRTILLDDSTRKRYDKALANASFAPVADMIRSLKAGSPFISASVYAQLVEDATRRGIPLEKAKFLIFKTADSIQLPIAADDITENKVQCRFCGALNDKGTANCRSCGMPIVIHCPSCGKPSKGDELACTQCGFRFGDMMKAPEYVKLIESALASSDYGSAQENLARLESVWKTHPSIPDLRRRCSEIQARIQSVVKNVEELCRKKEYYKARTAIASIAPTPALARLSEEAESAVQMAESRLLDASRITDQNAKLDKYMQILDICSDCVKAAAAIRSNPPVSPSGMQVSVSGSSARIQWTRLPSSFISYTVIRKEGGRPSSLQDGKQIADTSAASTDDTGLVPGVSYFYAVYSRCGEIYSRTGAVSDKPSMAVCDVDLKSLSYDIRKDSIGFSMQLPQHAEAVEIYRDGALVKTIFGTSYMDTGLVTDREYLYRFVTVFKDSASAQHKSAGVALKLRPMAPPDPVHLNVDDGKDSARLSWNIPRHGMLSVFVSDQPVRYHANDVVNIDVIKLPRLNISGSSCTITKNFSGVRYYLPITIQGNVGVVGNAVRVVSIIKPSGVRFDKNDTFILVRWNWENISGIRIKVHTDNANPKAIDLYPNGSPAQFKADFSREAKSVRVSVCSIVKSGTETLLSDAIEETFSLSVAKVAFEKVSKAFFGDKYTLELTSDSILPCSLSLLISENFPPNDLTNFRSYLTIAPGELKPGETLKKSVQYSRRMKGKPLYFRLIATDRTAAKQVLVVPETRNIK